MKKILPFIFLLITTATLSAQNKQKTYLLVHGAWHGAWCWDKVVPFMTSKGYKVRAIDLPGHGKDTTHPATLTHFNSAPGLVFDFYKCSIVAYPSVVT